MARAAQPPTVRHLRQILLWPLRLMHPEDSAPGRASGSLLDQLVAGGTPWHEVHDEYTGGSDDFHERHYNEFVSFLPYVQQFIYGEGRDRSSAGGAADASRESPMRVFRRNDIAALRVVPREGDAPITLDVVHIDLYFFFDVDVVILNVEVGANDLTLPQAHEMLYRFGRAYPAGWDAQGQALHCMAEAEWLDADGGVLASSDAQERELFLSHVATHRAPRTSAHWAFVMQPLVAQNSQEAGELRYRQIEYYRMPMMAYLALDDPRRLTRADFIRLGLVTGAGADTSEDALPYGEQHLADFERNYCYDRFWSEAGAAPNTRYLCNGHALIVVGDAGSQFFGCRDRGVLAQFRHQHFLLFLIAHFQKASLLMFSDQLVEALKRLDIRSVESVKRFKRAIRASFERFLRFTHRYWFHEISQQAQVKALSRLCARHLGLDELYDEVRVRIDDMNAYLEADSLRRQANTVVRLTVVTLFGLIGTVTTGFLGMNLLAEADAPLSTKLAYFGVVFVFTTWLTVYTMIKSKRLSDFLDALSNDRMPLKGKLAAFLNVWRAGAE
ncbi:hypothetical protein QTH91_17075 [Variovorax dokdonensis]|uniref:CorA-like Mg2+ transporter protein n=1 Tax=Variovorax dokdonensis TaxID=344883 RepID=A0ABT7NE59_9BURK|nr:hypothetical protein [Variovorax dokdonensis]MDM0046207.1 hypothetical protein [Variovorax dokdonensis]